MIFVADTESNSSRAKAVFHRFLPADRLRGVTSTTPLGIDHFIQFLEVRQQSEMGGRGVLSSDLKTLREGEALYTSLEHQALYSAWKIGSTTVEKIRQRFLQTSMRANFSTVVLPYPPHTRPVTRPLLPRISHEIPTSYAGRWCQGEVCAGGGSDPLLRSSRVGSAALVAPAPLHIRHPKISDADISLICAGYKPDQFSISR